LAATVAELTSCVKHLLQPGEEIVWVGQPDARQFYEDSAAMALFAPIPLAFGIGPLVAFLATGVPLADTVCFLPFMLGFTAIGLRCLVGPWLTSREVGASVYAVTTRRALILNAFGWSRRSVGLPDTREKTYEFGAEALRGRSRKRRGRRLLPRTDLVFLVEEFRAARGKRWDVEVGFLGLANPVEAEAALDRLSPAGA
jgi:hypothetical protein